MREVGRANRFLGAPAASKQRSHAGCLANADGGDVWADELHGVVDGHAGRDGATRRIHVERNVFLRIFGFEKQHLGNNQVCDIIINRSAEKNNIVPQ